MARRSEHTQDEIKQMVIEAAETIIVEDGIAKLNVRNIAREIGYTVGSIYMVFNGMADLIMHLKARTLDDIALHLQQVPTENAPQYCIIALSKAYLNFAQQNFNRWQMLFDQAHVDRLLVPEWYKLKLTQLSRPVAVHFERLAPQSSNEATQRAANALWGGVQGICLVSLSGSVDELALSEVEATVVLLAENFIRGWILPRL